MTNAHKTKGFAIYFKDDDPDQFVIYPYKLNAVKSAKDMPVEIEHNSELYVGKAWGLTSVEDCQIYMMGNYGVLSVDEFGDCVAWAEPDPNDPEVYDFVKVSTN